MQILNYDQKKKLTATDFSDGFILVGKGARITAGCSASYRFHRWGAFINRFSKAHCKRIQH
jgi:hypothetical protein